MATNQGSGSTLVTTNARRRQIDATRKRLNIGADRGGPQAPVRQNAPPPTAPAETPETRAAGAAPPSAGATAPEEGSRERMLARVGEFLNQAKAGRPDAQPPPATEAVEVRQPSPARAGTVGEELVRRGAQGVSPEQQFYRLAGRFPSPKEAAVFRSLSVLEQQLGRRATANELRSFLARPSSVGPSFPAAIEV